MLKVEKVLSNLVRPLVLSGAYKDEIAAMEDIVATHIENKIESYSMCIEALQEKYGKDFDTFTKDIKNKATPELEDDWMEWKGAVEMKKVWNEVRREAVERESIV